MKSFTIPIQNLLAGQVNKTLLVVLVGLFGMYSFFIARSVVAINQRKALYGEIRTMQAKVADLEIGYFNLASGIDKAKAYELGFVDAPTPTFAYTHPNTDAVAVR